MIPNPAYKGEWKARQIPNDDFVEDLQATTCLLASGLHQCGSIFDNILVTDDLDLAISRGKAIVDNAEAEKDAEEAYKKAQEALKRRKKPRKTMTMRMTMTRKTRFKHSLQIRGVFFYF